MEIIYATLTASIISIILGFLWYSPLMFQSAWMRYVGVSKEGMECSKRKMSFCIFMNFLFTLLTSFVIYILLSLGFDFVGVVAIWAGLSLPIFAGPVFWEGKSWRLFYINAGYSLVSLAFIVEALMWFLD